MKRWEELGYADRTIASLPSGEPMIELPFAMKVAGKIIRGRIDAVYETDDGGLEIVDFKTGRTGKGRGDADQLSVYREALEFLGLGDRGVKLAYASLGDRGAARGEDGEGLEPNADPVSHWSDPAGEPR
jgi:hypothetical protein